MVDKEMLSAISELLDEKLEEKLEKKLDEKFDQKLQPVFDRLDVLEKDMKYVKEEQLEGNVIPRLDGLEADMKYVRVVQLENNIIPRLNTIEAYYIDTSKRYMESTGKIGEMSMDISILKSTVKKHSQKLEKVSV